MPRSALAVRAHRIVDATPARVMPVRLVNGHVHCLALLAITELGVVMLCVYGAVLARFSGTFSAFQATMGPIWPRALLIAGVILLGLAAMVLYQLRHRARFTGILSGVPIDVCMREGALGLIVFLSTELIVSSVVHGLAW